MKRHLFAFENACAISGCAIAVAAIAYLYAVLIADTLGVLQ